MEEMEKAGIKEGPALHKSGKIDTVRQLSATQSTYSLVTGKDTMDVLYTADKLAALSFMALF